MRQQSTVMGTMENHSCIREQNTGSTLCSQWVLLQTVYNVVNECGLYLGGQRGKFHTKCQRHDTV